MTFSPNMAAGLRTVLLGNRMGNEDLKSAGLMMIRNEIPMSSDMKHRLAQIETDPSQKILGVSHAAIVLDAQSYAPGENPQLKMRPAISPIEPDFMSAIRIMQEVKAKIELQKASENTVEKANAMDHGRDSVDRRPSFLRLVKDGDTSGPNF